MARVAIFEPVQETRELLERLLRRHGHETVTADAALDPADADALVFEAGCASGVALARLLRAARPDVALVACSPVPQPHGVAGLAPLELLVQPFSPAQLGRAVSVALSRPATAASARA
ncbi:hypothetical protein GKE82_21120 [Conexibacter sp. W3-3-2]|uniref:hypothetical protein n=1 Tax=Conexibacter sp. W3-3-2 TaxID=2675227 RepID=UPI0012B8F87B|nr:hypothetical protein [Conexibacter sp. W3-3-2]MTD46722.1 hypothetical protein [Conexibacter sp. W3-3-2]